MRGKYYLGYTLRQLAESMGISLERARQLQAKGMSAMRRHETLLRPYLEEICTTHAYRGTGFSAWAYGGSVEERTVERLEREQRQFARSTARQLAGMLEDARQERGCPKLKTQSGNTRSISKETENDQKQCKLRTESYS